MFGRSLCTQSDLGLKNTYKTLTKTSIPFYTKKTNRALRGLYSKPFLLDFLDDLVYNIEKLKQNKIMSHAHESSNHGHGEEKKKSKKGLLILGAVVLVTLLIIGKLIPDKSSKKETTDKEEQSQPQGTFNLPEKFITVNFTDEFDAVQDLPAFYRVSFESITTDYSVKRAGDEVNIPVSSNKEDISDQLPPGKANRRLLFKARDEGKSGSLVIHLVYDPTL